MSRTILLTIFGLLLVIVVITLYSRLQGAPQKNAIALDTPTPPQTQAREPGNASGSAVSKLQDATVGIPQTPGDPKIRLTNGSGEYNQDGYKAFVSLLPEYSVDRQTAEGYDLFSVISVNYGGSGNFMYLTLFQDVADVVSEKDSVLLGSQIRVTGLTIQKDASGKGEYLVIVSFNELGPNQAMSETPKVSVTKTFTVKKHAFISLKPTP